MISSEGSGYTTLQHNLPNDTAHIEKWVNVEKAVSMVTGTTRRLRRVHILKYISCNIYSVMGPPYTQGMR